LSEANEVKVKSKSPIVANLILFMFFSYFFCCYPRSGCLAYSTCLRSVRIKAPAFNIPFFYKYASQRPAFRRT
jgi:hypothetical protein